MDNAPFPKEVELVSTLADDVVHDNLPARLGNELSYPVLDELYPHLDFFALKSSDHIDPIHKHLQKGRKIVLTEDPNLHLVWNYDTVYIKPLPHYLLNHLFWNKYLAPGSEHRDMALGFVRSYERLVRYPVDFLLAKEARLLPWPPSPSSLQPGQQLRQPPPEELAYSSFAAFIRPFARVEDVDPLIFALSSPEPETAIELLERGADPNVLIKERQYSWGAPRPNGGCALDIVRNHLQTLRQYQQDAAQAPARPTLPEGIDAYLDRFEEGTYQYWVVSRAIDNRRKSYEQQLEAYEKQRTTYGKPLGDQRKEAAIAEAILKLEKVQEVLLAKGAKAFSQICPDSTLGIQPTTNQKGTLASQNKQDLFTYDLTFCNVSDVTETRQSAYLKLFTAALNGDLEIIKVLTLASWSDGEERDEAPLKIAVHDQDHNNPFSLALSHGHYGVARAVLEIAHAHQIVDEVFTIGSVGEVSMKVKSRTKPMDMVNWAPFKHSMVQDRVSPLHAAILDNDMAKLKFLLDISQHWTMQEHKLQVKPRYYQGLTVYGKKRNDWAKAGRNRANRHGGTEKSPLLIAASASQIETFKWFLSDTPLRQYLAFANSKGARNDARLKHLAQTPGGVEGAISKWLNDQSELVLHAALFSRPSKRATELAAYLVRSRPFLVDVKAANGVTPLHLAYQYRRFDIAKILIEAGADQETKDRKQYNLLHAALRFERDVRKLIPMLDLLDHDTLVSMIKERNGLEEEEGGQTPLHFILCRSLSVRGNSAKDVIRVIKMFVEISPENTRQAFRMLDGAGNTPLHTLLLNGTDPAIIRAIVDFDPSLLYFENAVGRTPAEVAHDRYLAHFIKIKEASIQHKAEISVASLTTTKSFKFVKEEVCDEPREHEVGTNIAKNWRFCSEALARNGSRPKRTLVSLDSARFVAQRLARKQIGDKTRYSFQLVTSDEKVASGPADTADYDTQNNRVITSTAHRAKDFITEQNISQNHVWYSSKVNEEEGAGTGEGDKTANEEQEDGLFPVCSSCKNWHFPLSGSALATRTA
ncbi:hypothetical protein VTI28DRAFT_2434 [Corynascus sepedonium]